VVERQEIDTGSRPGVTTEGFDELKALRQQGSCKVVNVLLGLPVCSSVMPR
jgi:hypothetical protein